MKEENDLYHEYLNGQPAAGKEIDEDVKQFLDDAGKFKSVKFAKSKADIWNAIDAYIESEDQGNHTITRKVNWQKWTGIAAAVVLVVISSIILLNNEDKSYDLVSFQTEVKEQKDFELPDGSHVYLNASSELNYNNDWGRAVNLNGEAFFEVTKGDKFTIHTAMGNVQVLGTSFNVSVRDDVFTVRCKTGKVKVSFLNDDQQPVFLTRGEIVTFEQENINENKVDPLLIGNWKIGEYHYKDRPLIEVLAEIERQYGVEVKLIDKTQAFRPYNGYFIKEKLEVALTMVCEPMGLTYKMSDGIITVKAE